MLGKKKKEVIMSIERDGRIREFNTIDDAAYLYQLPQQIIQKAIDTKAKVRNIWFRKRSEKNISKNRMSN